MKKSTAIRTTIAAGVAAADRFDEASYAGDLTSADKASVLKAFDAGVLGGPISRP